MDHETSHPLEVRHVRRRRDHAAQSTDASFLHVQTLEGLAERLTPIDIEPRQILDLGCGGGETSQFLARRWRRARVISMDLSMTMLHVARKSRSRFGRRREIQAEGSQLPLATASFDLAVSNLSLPWVHDPARCLGEVARVLKPGGLFLFASLGPDTLTELRAAWAEVDNDAHVQPFADMHDVGDAMVRSGLAEPVLDIERLSITYRNLRDIYRDLTAAAARNALSRRRAGLTGRQRFAAFEAALNRRFEGGSLALGIELVYGHAWRGQTPTGSGEVRLDPGSIGVRRRP